MAAKNIKKNETVIWLPPRSIGERSFASEPSLVALIHDAEGPRFTRLSLDALPAVRMATLIFDARDVTLIQIKLPPLSGAKLRQALPNAIEDRLLQDPQSCLFALGPSPAGDEPRLVAVTDRSWLDFVVGAFERRGVRITRAIPAQLAASFDAETASVICVQDGLALRTGVHSGLGWTAGDDRSHRIDALGNALATVLAPPIAAKTTAPGDGAVNRVEDAESVDPVTADTLAGLPASRIIAFVEDDSWLYPVSQTAKRLNLPVDFEPLPIPGQSVVDLLDGRGGSNVSRRIADIDWRAWRLPGALAAACLAVFLLGINLHWGKLATEKSELRADMERRFRETFPETTVVVDPLLQMEREVARLRAGAGQTGPEDFLPLMTRFSQALGSQADDALTSLEYRDGRLLVSFQPSLVAARSVREKMQQSCKQVGLNLQFAAGQTASATVGVLCKAARRWRAFSRVGRN